ncbi:MAG TPA: hypothetical protein VFA55_02360 [Candidatus Kapabacteria bacterium]|nr:hypothetical protein [Candidatus Kapabacteria bacterium]
MKHILIATPHHSVHHPGLHPIHSFYAFLALATGIVVAATTLYFWLLADILK